MNSDESDGLESVQSGSPIRTLELLSDAKVSPTARLVAVLIGCGVTDNKQLASLIGRSVRMVQIARNELRAVSRDEAKSIASSETHFAKPIAPSATDCGKNATDCAPSRTHARAQMESPSEIDSLKIVESTPLTPQAMIDSESEIDSKVCDEFHRICSRWGRKEGAIQFGGPTLEDTTRQLAGELRAIRVLHPAAPDRILHAGLIAALNTTGSKLSNEPSGASRGRGAASAAAYLRKVWRSEIDDLLRSEVNAEAHRRSDHHVHQKTLERRIAGGGASGRSSFADVDFPS